ncbi:hypothetical protein [Pseudaquabacterium rugosum]|uniref:Non-specific serine/threonine protein kinase n=1 Tax=Pseudaquabacterium rugosum TaxID=2984194 RepID=A0ABU9BDT7_9BURK
MHSPANRSPAPAALRQWALLAVRELVLSQSLDAAEEARAWEDTARRWRIANGDEEGNPAPSADRSKVKREPPHKGEVWWRKVYEPEYDALQVNETDVLKKLADMDPQGLAGLRNHVAHFEQSTKATRLAYRAVRTKDAGPNLDMWQVFAPCTSVGNAGLPLPLFAQPRFLAALTRQALIALDKLSQLGFVHVDVKPGNLCLAFPPGSHWRADRDIARGHWDLRALPLRLIDFELGFAPGVNRLPHEGDNDNWSPYLQACFREAKKEPQVRMRLRRLDGIDWGTDLWALGHTLLVWCSEAQNFLRQFSNAIALHWGVDGPAHRSAQDTVGPMQTELAFLRSFAKDLQACERPPADAQDADPTARANPPHRSLWSQLETRFKLGPGDSASRVEFQLIIPTRPLAVAEGSRWTDLAALRARTAAGAATAWARRQGRPLQAAARTTTAWGARHHRRLLAATAAGALAVAAVQGRGALAVALAPTVGQLARASLAAQVRADSPVQATLAPALLRLAGVLDDALPTRAITAELGATPQLPPRAAGAAAEADAATLAAVREANLRALALLADAPDAALQAPEDGRADGPPLGHRLLRQALESGRQLEEQAGRGHPPARGQPPAAPDARAAALARLHQRTAWPMAELLQVHLSSCYGAPQGRQPDALRPALASLLALDRKQAVNREFYIPSAEVYAQRLEAGQDPCYLPAATPG